MKRVASLYLPDWAIERLHRTATPAASPPEPQSIDLAPLVGAGIAERVLQCDAPKNSGWRPGARWARDRAEVAASVAALPVHQRPPMREMGRRSEAADHPFKAMPPDEAAPPTAAALAGWAGAPTVSYPGEGPHPGKHSRRPGSNDPHAGVQPFFSTGRSSRRTVAQTCREPDVAAPVAADPHPPCVTAQKVGSRVEIAAASRAARALGLTPGMAITQARACVPGLDIRDADPAGDRAELAALATLLARRWTPVVAVSDADGLLLDLSGVSHLHGGEVRLARRLVRMLARHGFTARVAIADTAGAAWAVARHASGAVSLVPPDAQGEALAALPVAALRLEDAKVELLHRLGVDTVGALAALPRGPLVRRFGAATAARLDQALGRMPEPLDPVPVPEPIVVVQRFAEPIATPEAIAHWLGQLVPRLCTALAEAGLGARALVFVGDRVDRAAQVIRIGFARPNRDPAHILRLVARRIEEIEPGYGLDALQIRVRRADPLGPQPYDGDLADPGAPDLGPLVDALANRIGAGRLWRTRPVESDVPERSVARVSPLDPPARETRRLKAGDVRLLDERGVDHPWRADWPRPARMLARPEPLDGVLAELPDLPPRFFTWRGQRHCVVRADGPERIFGEWWKRGPERHAVRDYFRVEDDAGARFWLFRRGDGLDPRTGDMTWHVHGAFG